MLLERMVLKMFNEDINKASAFVKAYIYSQEKKLEETRKLFDPKGPVIKGIMDDFEWSLETPWWKKILVRFRLMKR